MNKYHRLRRVNPEAVPSSYECRSREKAGRIYDISLNVAMIPGTTMSVVSLMDITERKQAMKELKKREQALAAESHRLHEMNTALKVLGRGNKTGRRWRKRSFPISVSLSFPTWKN
ncbi:MAG: hypothetical protein C0394_09035 [Syntrophus sp. (in: bacteria)]|nr:hypothetical protein [Syntrophus sp. (in: bacteria)]